MSSPDPDDGWQPPPLPRRLTDPVPVVLLGSAVWLVAFVVLGVLALSGARPADAWLWACAVGVGLGALGLGVLALQRRAGARGSRGAQKL
ncbi:DUF2530 domain-containing protein [Actinomycetospora endophytica]|uniref:DUF2530 domain-containing protein n=1 Tax=Actinomycetospora endophytica TaxID=2291215 RepID=A0ABS8P2U5_9PSEU|nr:DUF2530 domain-containing protein [Actinomycetospora endophytica]MCD2192307.1 DUF2530 domain-containing protein [Actinomycetospora endophytica]